MSTIYPFIPLVIVGLSTLLSLHVKHVLRPAWLAVGFVAVLCCFSDWILLAFLPLLGLSFGPVNPPLFMFNFLRLVLLLISLALLAGMKSSWQRIIVLFVAALFQVLFLAFAYDGLYVEPFRLTVTKLEIPQAPAFFPDRPLRIIQLTDLHIEHPTFREQNMLADVNSLDPDIIVLTGDYINKSYLNNPSTLLETRQLISKLHAPYGVFAVNGNMDTPLIMAAVFSGLNNVRILDDEILPIKFPGGTLYLVGVMTRDFNGDYMKIESLMANVPLKSYALLLYHYPERLDIASTLGVNLFLAGDTHGGQVRLPFIGAITLSSHENPYIMGKYLLRSTTLYVSRGIGMQGGIWPRIRFLCPPEIVVVNLGK